MKILIFGLTEKFGGVEKYILDRIPYWKKYNKIDLAFTEPDLIEYRMKIDMGVGIKKVEHLSNPIRYWKKWYTLLKEEQYDEVYCNLGFANCLLYTAVKAAGARLTVHAHNTRIDSTGRVKRIMMVLYHYLSRCCSSQLVDERYGCSCAAFRWLFGKKSIPQVKFNAIHSELYKFDKNIRDRVRNELGIRKDVLIVGHIGRFSYQKNHEFLLEIFSEMYIRDKAVRLLLINGSNEKDEAWEAIQQKTEVLGIGRAVLFLGYRDDIPKLMQAMDVFVLPSRFEGLPLVGVEAQAAGLPCFISDQVTREVKVTDLVEFLPITDPAVWAEAILKRRRDVRTDTSEDIKAAGYDFLTEMNDICPKISGGNNAS